MTSGPPPILCLDNRLARRCGQTRRQYKMASLHGHRPATPPKGLSAEDINAPPEDSSDEGKEKTPEGEGEATRSADKGGAGGRRRPKRQKAKQDAVGRRPRNGQGNSKENTIPSGMDDFAGTWSQSSSKRQKTAGNIWSKRKDSSKYTINIHTEKNQNGATNKRTSRKPRPSVAQAPMTPPGSSEGTKFKIPRALPPVDDDTPSSEPGQRIEDTQSSPSSPAFKSYGKPSPGVDDSISLAARKLDLPEQQKLHPTSSSLLTQPLNFQMELLRPEGLEMTHISAHLQQEASAFSNSGTPWTQENSESTIYERVCPLCRQSIDESWDGDFPDSKYLSIKEQTNICRAHKSHSAREQWRERGYPEIQWDTFASKVKEYFPHIDEILKTNEAGMPVKTVSYRCVLEESIKSGRSRTLRQALTEGGEGTEGLSPGYYGSKGAKILVETIIDRYGPQLRQIAAKDKIVSTVGVSGYVQTVLGPELAVMLVRDDMSTDEARAREILNESSEIGNLLNEEDDELVRP